MIKDILKLIKREIREYFFKNNFNEQSVIVLRRSTSRKAIEELFSYKVIFLKDEDANFLQLIVDKKEFRIKELTDMQVIIY